jgi:TonB family protein
MRNTFIASLLLSPMLIVTSAAASPVTSDIPVKDSARISTGIVAPQLVNPGSIHVSSSLLGGQEVTGSKVVLAFNVDENGNAHNVRVVKSANPELGARVVSQVQRAQFKPGTLDSKPIPVDMELVVSVQR